MQFFVVFAVYWRGCSFALSVGVALKFCIGWRGLSLLLLFLLKK